MQDAMAQLVGQHEDLAAVVGFVREHVGEHGGAGGPGLRPTAAGEFLDAAIGVCGESVGEHEQALRGAFFVGGGGFLDGAAVGIERRGTFQMRRGIFQPGEAAIVEVREDGGDGASAAFFCGWLGAPGARVESGED